MICEAFVIGAVVYVSTYLIGFCFLDSDLELGFYKYFGKSPRRLKGKVVFITGASSGIGEQLAIALAKHGVKLAIAARRKDELERVKRVCIASSLNQLEDKDVLVVVMDVTNVASHKPIFEMILRHFGTIDILVNNAGRSQRALWENIELSVDRELFELNVFSVVNLSRIAVQYFNRKGEGHVAVVSSLAGVVGAPFSSSYTGSKHALHGYFNTLRNEKAGKKITVSLLCPGPTYTNFLSESFTDKEGQKYGIPAKETDRRMTAERCGQLCAVALVNKLQESWMGIFPTIPFTYAGVYCPVLFRMAMKLVSPSYLMKMREGRESNLTEAKHSD